MVENGYGVLRVEVDAGVAFATIDAPPMNLLGPALLGALDSFTRDAAGDDRVRVVVLRSADPEFFIAHGDVELIAALPEGPPRFEATPNFVHRVVDRLRTLPKATIAQLEGFARGEAHVAGERDLGAAAARHALDLRDRRLRQRAQAVDDLVHEVRLRLGPGRGLRQRGDQLDVAVRDEELRVGAAQHDDANARVVGDVAAEGVERAEQGGAEQVHRRRVDRREGDAALEGHAQRAVVLARHGVSSSAPKPQRAA